jgi:uncharacterized protein
VIARPRDVAAPAAIDWTRWRTPQVRDLAWLIAADDIVPASALLPAGTLALDRPALADFLRVLRELDATPCEQWLPEDRTTRRLGRYAERLLVAWLRRSRRFRLLGHGIALARDGRTLGECDLLVETAGGAREHWELAVKCYLRSPGAEPAWLGPNPADGLAGKLAAMRDRQLLLHRTPEFVARFGPG